MKVLTSLVPHQRLVSSVFLFQRLFLMFCIYIFEIILYLMHRLFSNVVSILI